MGGGYSYDRLLEEQRYDLIYFCIDIYILLFILSQCCICCNIKMFIALYFVIFSNVDLSQRHKKVACILYETGIQHPLLEDKDYIAFIDKLPRYHQLTKKDLNNMLNICEYKDLVNGHMTKE